MRKVKWIFFGYLALVACVIIGIALSFGMVPTRDPHTLYLSYASNLKTLDPANIQDVPGSKVAGQVFETLYNYDYEARPYQLVPELAAELPRVSEDGLTLTIPIRKGIRYYDPDKKVWPDGVGDEITAHDFVYAFKRIANFHQASQNFSAMFETKIVGLDDFRAYTKTVKPNEVDFDRPVEGLKAVDDYTLVIKLNNPDPQLRYNLAHLPTAAVSRKAVEYWKDNILHHPIGSGPYSIREKDHLPEQRIVFYANPHYVPKSDWVDGKIVPETEPLPYIKRIQMDYFDEELPAWALFQQGMQDIAGIPKDTFKQAISATGNLTPEMQARGIILQKSPEAAVYYMGFNMQDKVLGRNKPLRQAMSMAFDRKLYIDLFRNGRGQPAKGPIPPGFPTYDPNLVSPYTVFDLDAARAKIKEAEKIQGGPIPTITFLVPDTGTYGRQTSEFVTKQMSQIGVNIRTEFTTWARFQEMVDNKQAQFYALGWVADYPDEQTFLQLFWSKNESPGPNSANYKNPAYDALYEKARVMQPGPERDKLYHEMQEIIAEDTPWMLTFYPVAYTLYYDWVENFGDNEYAHGVRKYYKLNEALRAERLSY